MFQHRSNIEKALSFLKQKSVNNNLIFSPNTNTSRRVVTSVLKEPD